MSHLNQHDRDLDSVDANFRSFGAQAIKANVYDDYQHPEATECRQELHRQFAFMMANFVRVVIMIGPVNEWEANSVHAQLVEGFCSRNTSYCIVLEAPVRA